MSRDEWLELRELAERYCPSALLDADSMTSTDARCLLNRLRRLAEGQGVEA